MRKTKDEWELWADYGYGKDLLVTYDKRAEALDDLKRYQDNEPNIRHWLVKKRVKVEPKDYEQLALLRAEKYGIYEYEVKNNFMKYISYFGPNERFIKVVHNLDTGEETRTEQYTTKKSYNYFTG